jgi:hypothetical protein
MTYSVPLILTVGSSLEMGWLIARFGAKGITIVEVKSRIRFDWISKRNG